MKPKTLANGIEIVSLAGDWSGGMGRIHLRAPLVEIRPDEKLVERLKALGLASQWSLVPGQTKNDNFNYDNITDVLPQDGDYISVNFRALSKVVVPGHWLDWTKDNVLQDSVAKLLGATVYPNHDFSDINNALGSVANAAWDETGAASGGVAGINAQYKIDALMNPRIARLLLMKPPAIHSTSMTVLFEFEYSHPDIALESKWKFFEMLGEDVDGEIVRLVVTNIIEYWEASLVFQGADRLAKQYDEEPDETDFADMQVPTDKTHRSGAPTSAKGGNGKEAGGSPAVQSPTPPNLNEEKTMKLTSEQKTKLGIEFDGEDVPESEIFKAAESLAGKVEEMPANLDELKLQAKAGLAFIEKQRAEVTRLAKLAELKADDDKAELPKVIADDIAAASFDRLVELEKHYQAKVAEKFPNTGRSSAEDSSAVETAGGVAKQAGKKLPKVSIHN